MRVTIEDIARMAHVSKATVSRVINDKSQGVGKETRQRVQRIINDVEYNPSLLARSIVTSKTKTLGLIIPDITNPFFPELVKAVEDYASQNGYTVILGNTDFSQQKEEICISTFIAKGIDGVILTSTVDEPSKIHNRLKKYNVPCVLLDRSLKSMEYDAGVFLDNKHSLFIATEYLIQHDNRKIVLISGPVSLSTSKERVDGYTQALKQYGIPIDERLLKYGNYTLESGFMAINDLQAEGISFTAILACNDVMAIGAIKALKQSGRKIPDEIEVIGFDNIKICNMLEPILTTIEQPIYELGQKATELLLMLIDGKKLRKKNFRLQAKLILRETTR